jgi:formylglycine-generating enzyme required for sulfatase activity
MLMSRVSGGLTWLFVVWLACACGRVRAAGDASPDSDSAGGFDGGGDAQDARCSAGMAYIPGGSYVLENKPGGSTNIDPFCMDVNLVTAGRYNGCGTCDPANLGDQCNNGVDTRTDDPANCLEVSQAEFYCETVGKSVPSEEQWEWAARGGPAANLYPWGNQVPTATDDPELLCWEAAREGDVVWPTRPSGTCQVGTFDQAAAHPFRLEDMSGNVWQWTCSAGPTGAERVVRGGGFDNTDPARMTTGFRNDAIPASTRHYALGFRCIQPPLM